MEYAYVYLPDGMADWEPGLITAELNSGRFFKKRGASVPVRTFSLEGLPVKTMGGFKVQPDMSFEDVRQEHARLLILPGGNTWQDKKHTPVLHVAQSWLDAGVLVAAICGATEAMAGIGMLDNRPHTSNSLEYLTMTFPGYHGAQHYQQQNVVADTNLITANNTASVQFAYAILQQLEVFSEATLKAWKLRFETHEPKYIMQIFNSLPKAEGNL